MPDYEFHSDFEQKINEPAQYIEKNIISSGMDVVGNNWKYVGWVREVGEKEILVDRKGNEILFIPLEMLQIEKETIKLNVSCEEVERQGWRTECIKRNW